MCVDLDRDVVVHAGVIIALVLAVILQRMRLFPVLQKSSIHHSHGIDIGTELGKLKLTRIIYTLNYSICTPP